MAVKPENQGSGLKHFRTHSEIDDAYPVSYTQAADDSICELCLGTISYTINGIMRAIIREDIRFLRWESGERIFD